MDKATKRPEKKTTLAYIESQYACFQAGIFTAEQVGLSLQKGGYFLYKSEVEKIIEAKKEDQTFDAKQFVTMLVGAQAIREGAAPAFGGADQIKLESRERALQVANNPESTEEVEQIMQIMSAIKALGQKVEKLINTKATVSLALKNKVPKKRKKDGVEVEEVIETSEVIAE